MSATTIRHPAGTATPLLTMPGFFSVEINGDWMPSIVEGEQRVLDLLDTRAAAKTTRILPSGEADARLAGAASASAREAVTARTVPAGDCFRSP